MPTTDEWQWIAIGLIALYAMVLAHSTAVYAKENRMLWETHLRKNKETN